MISEKNFKNSAIGFSLAVWITILALNVKSAKTISVPETLISEEALARSTYHHRDYGPLAKIYNRLTGKELSEGYLIVDQPKDSEIIDIQINYVYGDVHYDNNFYEVEIDTNLLNFDF